MRWCRSAIRKHGIHLLLSLVKSIRMGEVDGDPARPRVAAKSPIQYFFIDFYSLPKKLCFCSRFSRIALAVSAPRTIAAPKA